MKEKIKSMKYIMHLIIVCNLKSFRTRVDKLDYNFLIYLQKHSVYQVDLYDLETNVLYTAKDDEINIDIMSFWDYIQSNSKITLIFFTCMPVIPDYIQNYKGYYLYDYGCTCKYTCSGSEHCKFNHQLKYINQLDFCLYKYETYLNIQILVPKYKLPHMLFTEIYRPIIITTKISNDSDLIIDHEIKEYDILFYGIRNPEAYPFRNRLYYLLSKGIDNLRIKIIPYNKKREPNKIPTGSDLISLIQRSWLCIATKQIANLLLAKYYEIALCGSVVLGNYPDLEDERFLFNDNMIYIDDLMSDQEIIDRIHSALKDKAKLLEISKRTYEYFSNRYLSNHGVSQFDQIFKILDK